MNVFIRNGKVHLHFAVQFNDYEIAHYQNANIGILIE